MQLYLSSYKLGENLEFLQNWSKGHENKKIAIIPNALDVYPDGERKTNNIIVFQKELSELGFESFVLDLKQFFNKEEELNEILKNIGGVFVLGGNVFVLRQAMKFSGFDTFVHNQVDNTNFIYMGFSAGICVLSQNLDGIHLADEPEQDPYGVNSIIWEGLGIIDYLPVPHWESPNHAESHLMPNVVKYLDEKKLKYTTLRDGEVIIENLDKKQIL
ncbi:MAG: Type 1 glutamine amidotransferase-like domain-containing protein [bacterium]